MKPNGPRTYPVIVRRDSGRNLRAWHGRGLWITEVGQLIPTLRPEDGAGFVGELEGREGCFERSAFAVIEGGESSRYLKRLFNRS